ncbi:unnamed protein product [Camellia sinensis]
MFSEIPFTTQSLRFHSSQRSSMESENLEVAHEFRFFRVYKDGRVEKFAPSTEKIPPSDDPVTGVKCKDVLISSEPEISARIFLPRLSDRTTNSQCSSTSMAADSRLNPPFPKCTIPTSDPSPPRPRYRGLGGVSAGTGAPHTHTRLLRGLLGCAPVGGDPRQWKWA